MSLLSSRFSVIMFAKGAKGYLIKQDAEAIAPALRAVMSGQSVFGGFIREGSDVVVFATGVMVPRAVKAAEGLETEGISARVVSISTIKPLDAVALKGFCKDMKGVVTAEEHSIYAGLGSAVCEALSAERLPIKILGINDCFGISAESYDVILEKYHLMPADVAAKVREVLSVCK